MFKRMLMSVTILFLVLGITFFGHAWFKGRGHLSGTVIHEQTSQSLADVQITLEETGMATTTDAWGRFSFRDLPTGDHTLTARKSGFAFFSQTATIRRNETSEMPINLRPEKPIYDLRTWMEMASQALANIMTEREYTNLRIGIAFYRQSGGQQCGLPEFVLRFATEFNRIGRNDNLIVVNDSAQAGFIIDELKRQNQFKVDFDPAMVAAIGKKVGANVMIIGALLESRNYFEPFLNGAWVEKGVYLPGLSISDILMARGELRCE